MKKRLLFLQFFCLVSYCSFSQGVGIGTSSPDVSAALDVTAINKGLLIPRMNRVSINAIFNPAKGLLVYDSVANRITVNIGSPATPNWQPLTGNAGSSSGWNLTGNAGVDPVNQFIGTIDNQPLRFRLNNTGAGELHPVTGNISLGLKAGTANTTGFSNVAIGTGALRLNTIGANLVAIGDSALFNNTFVNFSTGDGLFNTAVGSKSLVSNTIGNGNTALGYNSLLSNTTGSVNTAIGTRALFSNTLGRFNTATGHTSLFFNTTGESNTANGFASMFANTSGHDNTASGFQSLFSNLIGVSNVAFGSQALFSNTSGNHNVAIGTISLFSNTIGFANTAVGTTALSSNVDGDNNTAMGFQALNKNTSGAGNIAIGTNSLFANTTGSRNTAMGFLALLSNTTGSSNTALGIETLEDNVNGNNNTAMGRSALGDNISGNFNVAIGSSALSRNTSSDNNVGIGFNAGGGFITGSFNSFIGSDARTDQEGLTNATAIGAGAVVNTSNKVRIGNSAVSVIEGQVPLTTPSDGRFKFNVKEDVKGLDFIMKLRPVTYQFDVKRFDGQWGDQSTGAASNAMLTSYNEATTIRRTGFIAQEVEKAADAARYNFSGIIKPKAAHEHYGLSYESFVVPLVKAMQEQQQVIEDLKNQNADLLKRVFALEKK